MLFMWFLGVNIFIFMIGLRSWGVVFGIDWWNVFFVVILNVIVDELIVWKLLLNSLILMLSIGKLVRVLVFIIDLKFFLMVG